MNNQFNSQQECAIMFADIAGCMYLYKQLGDKKAEALISTHLKKMCDIVELCHGRIIKTIGDEIMCLFSNAKDAALAAISIQQETNEKTTTPKLDIR